VRANAFDCPPSCPFVLPPAPELSFPVGQVRRLAAGDDEVDETRRNVLKLAAIAGVLGVGVGGVVGGALHYVAPPVVGLASFPKVQLTDVDGSPLTVAKVQNEYNVTTSELYLFDYPLTNEPNFLLNLNPVNGLTPDNTPGPSYNPGAWQVPGGIGPNNSIVAYSAICQHLGCPAPSLSYYPPSNPCGRTFGGKSFFLHCQCHGSTYDATNSASNLTGPAVLPLPQVALITDEPTGVAPHVQYPSGNIFAVFVNGPPVNGHLNTLQGGYGVGSTVPLTKQAPSTPLACNFPS
jgi:Rieske Fe-S protein